MLLILFIYILFYLLNNLFCLFTSIFVVKILYFKRVVYDSNVRINVQRFDYFRIVKSGSRISCHTAIRADTNNADR